MPLTETFAGRRIGTSTTEGATLGLSVLPQRLHQTWKDFQPPKQLFSPRWRHSLRAANPGWQYRLWSDDENRGLVAARYPWLLATYDGYPTPIQRADVARYLIVHTYGGIYADLDVERVLHIKSRRLDSHPSQITVLGVQCCADFWCNVTQVLPAI